MATVWTFSWQELLNKRGTGIMKKIISPSILSADFANLSRDIRSAEMGGADWIHCDIMDGHFVPEISYGPLIVKAVNGVTKLPLDTHLMVENPDNYIESYIKAGSSYVTVHQETCRHLHRTVSLIKELGAKAGVSVNPATPLWTLYEILEYVDLVLVMSVNPGFGGQKFIPSTVGKIKELNQLRDKFNYKYLIEVDGGINKETISVCSDAGCDVFVAGSAIFKADNIAGATTELKNLVNN